jgi:hypothetical protein
MENAKTDHKVLRMITALECENQDHEIKTSQKNLPEYPVFSSSYVQFEHRGVTQS